MAGVWTQNTTLLLSGEDDRGEYLDELELELEQVRATITDREGCENSLILLSRWP